MVPEGPRVRGPSVEYDAVSSLNRLDVSKAASVIDMAPTHALAFITIRSNADNELMPEYRTSLRVSEVGGRVRLSLVGFSHAEGATLQEAADELVRRMLLIAMAFRTDGIGKPYAYQPDPDALQFIWELGEIAARGEDIRGRLFGLQDAA
jgi:hypothetical protein